MTGKSNSTLPFSVLPGGTVTFLFTDIEGSTKLLKQLRERYSVLLDTQRGILQSSFSNWDGHVVDMRGEEFFVAFARASEAVAASVEAQQKLAKQDWPDETRVQVRIGIHTGEPWVTEESYVGMDVHRAARIANLGHGGQVLLSETTTALVIDELPQRVTLLDLGRHRMKDVSRMERIHQLVIDGLPNEFPPLKSLESVQPGGRREGRRHNLPVQLTPFIGREDELRTIVDRLNDPSVRLLTLLGVGGMGKTRLALQVAADFIDRFPDGVWLVEFAKLRDPELVSDHTADVFGVSAQEAEKGRTVADVLVDFLRERELLLVLDNCEHLIDACAALAEQLLMGCPAIKILATSRENFGLASEHTLSVPAMDVPDTALALEDMQGFEAIQFFQDRASSVLPMFKINAENVASIIEICSRLDGMPLAIELAAARVKILAPDQIATLLEDRFNLLRGGPRTALKRHQALQATLEWSYNLLSEPERQLFEGLSVFSGGWTLEDVEGVFSNGVFPKTDLLELLSNLADKSLVTVSHRQGATRYGMLETVNQYASELLEASGKTEEIRRRHADYFIRLAEEGDPKLRTEDQLAWLRRLDDEQENFRAALRWLTATDQADLTARLVSSLGWFWYLGGYWTDARRWLGRALDLRSDPDPLLRARAICRAGGFELIQGNLAGPPDLIKEALGIFREHKDQEGIAWCLNLLGQTTTFAEIDREGGRTYLTESIDTFRELGDEWGVAWSTRYLGQLAEIDGEVDLGLALQEEALRVFNEIGDIWNAAHSLFLIGGTYRDIPDYPAAERYYRESYEKSQFIGDDVMGAHALQGLGIAAFESDQCDDAKSYLKDALEIMERIGDENCTARVSFYLSRVAEQEGDYNQATSYLADSIQLYQKLERDTYVSFCLTRFALFAEMSGDFSKAAQLLGAATTYSGGKLADYPSFLLKDYDDVEAKVRENLPEDQFNLAFQAGSAMTINQAIEYAMASS